MAIDFLQVDEGTAILIIGLLALIATMVVGLKNYLAGIMWGISVIVLIWSGAFGLGLEWFWMSLILTGFLVIGGFVVRGFS